MRAFNNPREFLQLLEAEKQFLWISEEVSLEPDLAATGRAVTQLSETSPAIHFDRIKGYHKAPVVLNVHGSSTNLALMLGMEDASLREQFFEFVRRYEQFPGEMEHNNGAPWQEVVVDKDVNFFELMPLFRFNRGDGGFFMYQEDRWAKSMSL
jgi:vanillate/4-hydroxybenzoate decarboxylase subunit C